MSRGTLWSCGCVRADHVRWKQLEAHQVRCDGVGRTTTSADEGAGRDSIRRLAISAAYAKLHSVDQSTPGPAHTTDQSSPNHNECLSRRTRSEGKAVQQSNSDATIVVYKMPKHVSQNHRTLPELQDATKI